MKVIGSSVQLVISSHAFVFEFLCTGYDLCVMGQRDFETLLPESRVCAVGYAVGHLHGYGPTLLGWSQTS